MTRRYLTEISGVVIETPFELYGGRPVAAGDDASVDLTVTLGPPTSGTSAALDGAVLERSASPGGQLLYSAAMTEGATVFRVHGIGDILFSVDFARADVHLERSSDLGLLVVMMAGMVPAFWLMARNEVVLHSSAVYADGVTVAFVGNSGMGKSTLAMLCCAAGAQVVADDLLRVTWEADEAWWIGGTSELRLRPGAWALLEDSLEGAYARATADGRRAVAPPVADVASGRLDLIVVPQLDRSATAVTVAEVPKRDALVLLSQFPRLQGWRDPARVRAQFAAMAAIARTVPVRRATVPWGPPFDPRIGRQLLDHALGTHGR